MLRACACSSHAASQVRKHKAASDTTSGLSLFVSSLPPRCLIVAAKRLVCRCARCHRAHAGKSAARQDHGGGGQPTGAAAVRSPVLFCSCSFMPLCAFLQAVTGYQGPRRPAPTAAALSFCAAPLAPLQRLLLFLWQPPLLYQRSLLFPSAHRQILRRVLRRRISPRQQVSSHVPPSPSASSRERPRAYTRRPNLHQHINP